MANLKIIIYLAVLLTGSLAGLADGYVASSSNYILQSDSVNFGGGYSTSSAYRLQDTLGEVGTGIISSSSIMSGGYQAMSGDTYVAVTVPAFATMTPAVNGAGGGVSNGSTTIIVQTDNPAGYELSVQVDSDPALAYGAYSFADYAPSYAEADYTWSTPIRESRFGYTVEGDDIVAAFKDNGVSCGVGGLDTANACWQGFTETATVISRAGAANVPAGATTVLKLRAELGSKKPQQSGDYRSNISVSAVTL